jgi:hypothetical protein
VRAAIVACICAVRAAIGVIVATSVHVGEGSYCRGGEGSYCRGCACGLGQLTGL